jgi:hypothetical protein
MPNNHIIIGLGGTGGNIIRAFRKILWVEHRNMEPRVWDEEHKRWSEPVANLAYLYVDSNDKELNQSDGLWQWLGQSLALNKSDRLLIRDANMEAALQNLKQNPGISGWIGDPDVLRTMIQNSRGSEGANQIRRFGRYLFAQSGSKFANRINESVRTVTEGGAAKVTFHVCCTLGCGTGSGSVVDAISQIRKLYPEGATHPIFLYCLVNAENVSENVGFFYPNQYSALTELNALRQGAWKPHDVVAFTEKRLENLRDNFQCCFLMSPINEKDEMASKDEQQDMIAAYIYQKTVALQGMTPPSLHKAESFEDLKAHSAILKDRSTTFGSFGIKRFRIPEEEIREKLSYSFSSQAALQSLFNNWSENGFVKAPLNRDLPGLVTDPENNGRWYLTDDHLKISKDFVLAGAKVWKSIPDEWKITLENKKESLLKFKSATRKDRETWLNEMLSFAQALFDKNFRDRGVNNYYQDKRDAILDYAREIRKRIEMDLFDRWKVGDDSVTDTQRIIDALTKHLEQRKAKFDQRITEAKNQEKSASERMREAETKWHGIGWLTDWITSKPAQLLGTFTNVLIDKYTASTEAVACGFAKELVQQVINQLTETRNSLVKVSALFTKLAEDYEKEVKSRIRGTETIEPQAKEVRLVEPKEIDQTIRALLVDNKVQQGQCAGARSEIAAELGTADEEQTFSSFAKKINQEQLGRIVFKACDRAGATSHTALFKAPTDLHRILGRNVIEKLYEDYGGVTDALKQIIQTLVQSSAAYMRFDRQQTQPAIIYRRDIPEMPRRTIVVFMPKAKELEDFRQQLKDTFTGAFEDKDKVQVVDTDNNPNEILIISVSYWFEVRFINPLAALQEKYEDFIRSGEVEAVHQTHLENQRAPIKGLPTRSGIGLLPRLDYQGADVEDFLCYVLLGMAVGFVLAEENTRGISTLHYAKRDADGMSTSDLKDLGSLDPLEASKRMPLTTFETIKADLDEELQNSYQHVEKKKSLVEKLDALSKAKFVERGRKNTDPIFQSYRAKVEEAKSKVNEV